jgi:hypothetical protein
MPRFSDDDFVNFCVLEALVQRGERDREEAEQNKEEEDFRKSHKGWDPDAGSP